MADIAGTAYLNVGGVNIALVGECSYKPSGKSREELMGQDGYHGTKSKPAVGFIKFKGRNLGSISLNEVAGWDDVQASLELANGKIVTGNGMFAVEAPTAETEDGTYDIELRGPSVVEA